MQTIELENSVLIPAVGKLIRQGRTVTLRVKGRSMSPFVHDGEDRAVIEACTNVKVGDALLVLTTDRRYVLHRLIRIDGDTLTLKGDGCLRGTENCTRANIIGRVAAFIRPSDTTYSTSGTVWRLYSWIWMHTGYWFHRIVLGVWRRICR